jgi:phosphate/sulfate permease
MVFSWLVTLPVAFVVAFVAHGVLRELGAVR